jgi:hypothetical protein
VASTEFARAASAQGDVARSDERRLVSVQIAGDAASVDAVLAVLREREGGSETTFEIVPAIDRASVVTPGPPNARQLARIWIDLTVPPGRESEPPPITIYVVDGPWERVLVRPVVRQPNAEITWEEIGHIVELAVDALRAGESIGVAREQLLPPPSPPPTAPSPIATETPPIAPAPAPARPWKLRGGGFYSATAYGSGFELASGPGAMLELQTQRPKLELGGALTGEYRFPSRVDRGSATVHFEGGALHALANAAFVLGARHQLGLGLGGGVELVQAHSSSIKLDNVRFFGTEMQTIPTTRALARYTLTTSSVRLFAGLGVDVPLRRPRYLLTREDAPVVLFEPWAVRPFVLLGIETN